jgi:hypothetical protein
MQQPLRQSRVLDGGADRRHQHPAQQLRPPGATEPVSGQAGAFPPDDGRGANGVLNLLPTQPPGSPGTVGVRGKRKLRSFVIPHIPHDDVMLPEEVQGHPRLWQETEAADAGRRDGAAPETMRNKHAITLEHCAWVRSRASSSMPTARALRPVRRVRDHAQGVAFDLGNANTNVKKASASTSAATSRKPQGRVHDRRPLPVLAGVLRRADRPRQCQESLRPNWQNGAILRSDVRRASPLAASLSRSTAARPTMADDR